MNKRVVDARDVTETEYQPELGIPPAGSWAAVAGMMAGIEPNFDWDGWKDEMKEQDA